MTARRSPRAAAGRGGRGGVRGGRGALLVLASILLALTSVAFAAGARAGGVTAEAPTVSTQQDAGIAASAPLRPMRTLNAPQHALFVGVQSLTWDDVTAPHGNTPRLRQFAAEGLVAQGIVNNGSRKRCALDGWLALSSGSRFADRSDGHCRPVTGELLDESRERLLPWQDLVREAADLPFRPQLGLFGDAIANNELSGIAIGPGAAIALADSGGALSHSALLPESVTDLRTSVAASIAAADVTVVDLSFGEPTVPPAEIDARFAAVIKGVTDSHIDPALVTLTVASLSDSGAVDAPGTMQFLARGGQHIPAGVATSTSTRQPGMVLTTDISTTLLRDAGVDEASLVGLGRPIEPTHDSADIADSGATVTSASAEQRFATMTEIAGRAAAGAAAVVPYLAGLAAFAGVVFLLALVPWRREIDARIVQGAAIALALFPAATIAANASDWWRFAAPTLALAVVAAALVGVAAVTAWAMTRYGWVATSPAAGMVLVIAVLTWLVIATDVLRGAPLSLGSPLGTQPLLAGRFYGMNNTAFAFYAVSSMVLIAMAGRRVANRHRIAGMLVSTAFAVVCIVINAHPRWGADFGGALALAPGCIIAIAYAARWRVTWRRVGLIALIGAPVAFGIGYLDSLRPTAQRTHMGEFVATLFTAETAVTIQRKLSGAFGAFATTPWLAVVAVACIAGITAVLWRLREQMQLGQAGIAVGVTCLLAVVLNDSGLAIAAWMGLLGGALVLTRRGPRRKVTKAPTGNADRVSAGRLTA